MDRVLDPLPKGAVTCDHGDILTIPHDLMERMNEKYGKSVSVHAHAARAWNEQLRPQESEDVTCLEPLGGTEVCATPIVTVRVCGDGMLPKPSGVVHLPRLERHAPHGPLPVNATYNALPVSLKTFVAPYMKVMMSAGAKKYVRVVRDGANTYRVQRDSVEIAVVKDTRLAVLLATVALMDPDIMCTGGGLQWLERMLRGERHVQAWIQSVNLDTITKRNS